MMLTESFRIVMIQTLVVWPLLRVITVMKITTHQLLVRSLLNLLSGLPHQFVHVSSVLASIPGREEKGFLFAAWN